MFDDSFCPACGEEMEHWHMGILECPECGTMIDLDEFDNDDEVTSAYYGNLG